MPAQEIAAGGGGAGILVARQEGADAAVLELALEPSADGGADPAATAGG